MRKAHLLVTLALVCCTTYTMACTNFLFTKGATKDGSTMVTYSADSHVLYGELYHWPAQDWPAGSMLDVYEWDTGKFMGKIPQVAHTYNVVGNMNEHQLAISETTFGGRKELESQTGAIIDYGSAIYITLQRAREAIVIMTDLIEKYGWASSGESISIIDPNEVWIIEIIGKGEGEKGAVWVARMVPDGYVSAHANQARITTFPLEGKTSISSDNMNKIYDTNITTVYAKDVISFAKEKGFYPQDGKNKDFSFSDTYAPVDFSGARACEIRVWAFFNAVNPDMAQYWAYATGRNIQRDSKGYATNRMPLWIKPSEKVDVMQVMDFMRDHLEGTELDMSKDMGAGPYECPYRWRPMSFKVDGKEYVHERATATQQTGFTFVAQCRSWLPDEIGGILWFGVDDANMAVFTPVYCCTTKAPLCYTRVDGADYITFSWNSAFWIFNWVSNMVYPRYDLMIGDVRATQKEMETTFNNAQEGIEEMAAKLLAKDKNAAIAFLTNYTNMTAQSTFDTWKQLGTFLIVKYNDGVVKRMKDGQFERNSIGQPAGVIRPGYPKEFLEEYVKQTGERYLVK